MLDVLYDIFLCFFYLDLFVNIFLELKLIKEIKFND